MTTEDFQISWLHCNICHRAFEGHNQVKLSGDRLILSHSDLYFYFTGCGHFFCENCLQQEKAGGGGLERIQGNIRCKICGDHTQAFKIQSTIPDKVAMYMKPPINLLEDSLSIMMFQLNNANKLINALRLKISSQKDLLSRAKQEIANVKELKEYSKQHANCFYFLGELNFWKKEADHRSIPLILYKLIPMNLFEFQVNFINIPIINNNGEGNNQDFHRLWVQDLHPVLIQHHLLIHHLILP